MRPIKFRSWNYINKMMIGWDTLQASPVLFMNILKGRVKHHQLMQFTGLQDKNGVDIYENDLLNVFFTSNNGEHIHDCIYQVTEIALGGIELRIRAMMWESYGWNQDTLETTLSEKYSGLSEDYLNRGRLMVDDSYGKNHMHGTSWKETDESRYFEVIGNIHENPELLEALK